MPSYALAELSKQIESQPTDSFGKFYLYAALLNTIAVRKERFLDGMPKYQNDTARCKAKGLVIKALNTVLSKPISTNTVERIAVGDINEKFAAQVSNYKSQYENIGSNFIRSVQNIFLAFARKGQLSDLIFIIDKMHAHLNTSPLAATEYNQEIHGAISFKDRKVNVNELLEAARKVTKHAQNSVDNAMYGFGTLIAAMLAIHLTMALGGIFLTLAMLGIGACAVFYFLQAAVTSFESIENAVDNCKDLFNKMLEKHEKEHKEHYELNNLNFIIKGVLFPIAYAGVTAWEQIAATENEVQEAAAERALWDESSKNVSNVYLA